MNNYGNLLGQTKTGNRIRTVMLALGFGISILAVSLDAQLANSINVGNQQISEEGWRRTTRGWEYAHAVQIVPPSMRAKAATGQAAKGQGGVKNRSRELPQQSRYPWARWHVYALPLAAGTFFISFGWWLLVDIPNRAIVRGLREV